jgi:5'-3' exoribonuclease 2
MIILDMVIVYLLKHKSEGFEMFKKFKAEVENQSNKKIIILRTDRGGEYTSVYLLNNSP